MLELVVALAHFTAAPVLYHAPAGSGSGKTSRPLLDSARRDGQRVVLSWKHSGARPPGGFDVLVNGKDTGKRYRTHRRTAVVAPVDRDSSHCFRIKARYPATRQFPTSGQVCVTKASGGSKGKNAAPSISGSPSKSAEAGDRYVFLPKARDPNGDDLRFLISYKPSWASFDQKTGRLSGTPGSRDVRSWKNIKISVSDGRATAALAPFTIRVAREGTGGGGGKGGGKGNEPPVIRGTPPGSAVIGESVSFTPEASDPDGDRLSFSVRNRPEWLKFEAATGRLYGTPAPGDEGAWRDVVLHVSDGRASDELGPFDITVSQIGESVVTLSWIPPTEREDGSSLRGLAGYRIHMGRSRHSLDRVIEVKNGGLASYTIDGLTSGTWYLAMTAFDSDGLASRLSSIVQASVK